MLTFITSQVRTRISILAGVILIGQIAGQIRMLRQPVHWIEVIYIAAGMLMVALGPALRPDALIWLICL